VVIILNDPAASTLAKLKNKSKKLNLQFQQILVLFSQEELIRRISLSNYKENFILKGGYLIYSISEKSFRPTIDSDFLIVNHPLDIKNLKKVMNNVINQKTQYDYVKYEVKNYESITEQMKYNGIRVNLISKIKNTRTHINIDFATGDDYLIPEFKTRNLRTILEDFEKPNILTYSLESIVSEKLDSILYRMELNSRMKDYYDIYFLLNKYQFSGEKLKIVITKTLNNRNRNYSNDSIGSLNRLINNRQLKERWDNFCSKILNEYLNFDKIIEEIIIFLKAPYKAYYNSTSIDTFWNPNDKSYN